MTYTGPATAEMPNGQPVEKFARSQDGSTLDVHSIFFTIQGEGPFCGTPAVFIRLAGCNLQCPFCDTEYTEGRRTMRVQDIVVETVLTGITTHDRPSLVVITGGEPFRQRIGKLLNMLVGQGFYVQIETNGTLAPPDDYRLSFNRDVNYREGAYIVCSPKSGKLNPRTAEAACCFKYVMTAGEVAEDDGLPLHALGHTANPRLARPPMGYRRPIYLQPADYKDDRLNAQNLRAVVDSAMEHGYIVQLQMHKLLDME